MHSALNISIDWSGFWAWFLLFVRFSGMFQALPGVGTEEVPLYVRVTMSMIIAGIIVASGAVSPLPETIAQGGLSICTEYLLGYALGAIPYYIIGALAVAGQVTAASIGLGQASLIDPSIGEHVSVIARLQALIGVSVFLAIDGHHTIIRAASVVSDEIRLGMFRPDASFATILIERFSHAFELAVILTGPVLVSVLITQFLLGLLTKFVPQVNVFIVSLPLTIGIGLFITAYTFPALKERLTDEFGASEELAREMLINR